jgi:RNA 3'-terminal phosphate cyclase-like protein
MASANLDLLEFKGSNYLKQKLVLSVLSGKSIKITDIRCSKNDLAEIPGLREFEVSLIRLIDKITK